MKRPSSSDSIGRAAFAALQRQSRNATQPGATTCNAVQQDSSSGKTNPRRDAMPPQPAGPRRQLSPITQFVLETAAAGACDALQRDATPRNAVQRDEAAGKTNPPPAVSNSRQCSSPLTPRQLAAARLIAAGRTLPHVAAELGVNRSTVWRWVCTPAFAAELARLHQQWSRTLAVHDRP